jgi:simple sugar transport system ATP-binding protein
MPEATKKPAVSMRDVSKRFGPVLANDGVNLQFNFGEVHALLGENGAGKSTAMNILYGLYRPDSGTIAVEGRPVQFNSPSDAIACGIGMVHQHFMLVPALTVLENIVLGLRSRMEPYLDLAEFRREVLQKAVSLGIDIPVDAQVSQLPVGVQQRVEILKALFRGARILILDEPTAVLTPQEVDDFFQVLKSLREAGYAIVLITHKLPEVKALCDQVTALRSGRTVGSLRVQDASLKDLARMMVGRDLEAMSQKPASRPGTPVLEIEDVDCLDDRRLPALRKVSLVVHRGEILGLAGVDGNGQNELSQVVAGMRATTRGNIRINGHDCTGQAPKACIDAGLGHVPQDRQRTGLVPDLSIAENLVLQMYANSPFAHWLTLDRESIASNAARHIAEFSIRTDSPDTAVRALSGGNQQKVILAREFSRQPDAMLAVQPTRGLDIGATQFVHEQLLKARSQGMGILLISTELEEILALSDRIAVIFEGRIVGILDSTEATRERSGLMMAGMGSAAQAEHAS